ncbi:MAG TPA: hypothetical protein VGC41_25440 [Kofleriaceae bacterium]
MIEAACAWVEAQLPAFALTPASPSAHMAMLKALGDLAHCGELLSRTPGRERVGTHWLDRACEWLADGERIHELVARNPIYAPAAATALPLILAGRVRGGLVETLRRQVAIAQLPSLAWTMLVPTLELCGISPSAEMISLARKTSVLAQKSDPARIPFDAAYVLAHECMYATKFSREDPPWDAATTAYACAALVTLEQRARAAADADLWAELAIAYRAVTGTRWLDTSFFSQTRAGNVEPPAELTSIFPRLPHPRLSRTYHTTLVAIMAWA